MKKLRGLIRLVRPAFPDYQVENAHFRDVARSLAGLRDAEVTAATLDGLIDTHEGALDPSAFTALRAEVTADRLSAPDLGPAVEALRIGRQRIELWTLHETGWDAVAGGLRKTYRRARRQQDAEGDEEFHAWRKPIKYHWYHVRLLREIQPAEMDAREEAGDAMGNHLGLLQDLAVLDGRVKRSDLPKEARRVLRGLIELRKSELADEVRVLAPRLLADKPKALVARWGELWEAWRG
jgi:CHAD domain-containing protein